MTGLIVLSELGVNTAPLLAGAGVVGLAVGFGSQALVKDLITGLFILLEDSVAVGDVATVAGHTGVVEAISIRTIKLRDLQGSVYSVPWSEVTSVINLTKDFSYYLLDVGVAYRENTDEVVAVLKELAEEMRSEAAFESSMPEPIEILGVDRFADSAVIIRARIKTPPLQQWRVGREFNRRIKLRFDELGIEIPFPHTTIYFGEDKKGEAPPARVMVGEVAELPAPKSTGDARPGEGEAG
jgi:small-conductance mechanosensitive channel